MKTLLTVLSIAALGCITSGAQLAAQNYHSKPTAVTNLADEAKYLAATMPQLKETQPAEYTIAVQKLRIIQHLLRALKSDAGVASVADRYAPSGDISKMQVGVARFTAPPGYTNRLEYLRAEIMALISY